MFTPQYLSPFTGTSNIVCLRKISTKEIADRWVQEIDMCLPSAFLEIGTIYHWRCLETEFEWYTPATAAGDSNFYEQLSQKDNYYSQEDKWEFRAAFDYIQEQDKVLEVGVGNAKFMNMAKKRRIQIEGVETNPYAAKKAQEKGFLVYQADIGTLVENLAERYDVVCSFQVLEHVPEPIGFISNLLCFLKKDGILIIGVPNRDVIHSFFIDPNYELLLDQPPHHMSHWNEKVFRYFPCLFPVKVQAILPQPLTGRLANWPVVTYIRNKLKKHLGLSEVISKIIINRYSVAPISQFLKQKYRKLFLVTRF